MLSWTIAGLGLLLALWALASVRRLSRRLDSLTQSYWELRYDYTRLRSQVARLDPDVTTGAGQPEPEPPAPPSGPSTSFVPLSAIRKKEKQDPV